MTTLRTKWPGEASTRRGSYTLRTPRPDIRAIQLANGNIVELTKDQVWYETEKCYEIWGNSPLRFVTRLRRSHTVFVFQHEQAELQPSAYPADDASVSPEGDELLKIARSLYRQLNEAKALLGEALDSVDADEQARRESWPDEIERGELKLTLAERIRAFLTRGEDAPQ